MPRLISRSILVAGFAFIAASFPQSGNAQGAGDTVLLSVPPASGVSCEEDRGPKPANAPLGARAFAFSVGTPTAQIRDASGRLIAAGPPPRVVTVVFDSVGHPFILVDELEISRWQGGSAIVMFGAAEGATGYRQRMATDSAAVMARVQREGLSALQDAIRQETKIQKEPLDSLDLQRATTLAEYLWAKRCP